MKIQRRTFYDNYRNQFGRLTPDQVKNLNDILAAIDKDGTLIEAEIAYIIATSRHESNTTHGPVKEGYWIKPDSKRVSALYNYYAKNNVRALRTIFPNGKNGIAFYGRGRVVQLTHDFNYKLASQKIFGDDRLVKDPDLVLEVNTDMAITIRGMKEGWFTSYKLSNFITRKKVDFRNARKIINGLDKAREIATQATQILAGVTLVDDALAMEAYNEAEYLA